MQRSLRHWIGASSLVAVAAGTACTQEVDELAPTVSSLEEGIINGTEIAVNGNAVAFYHKTKASDPNDVETWCQPDAGDNDHGFDDPYLLENTWWPRPCSGYLIRKDGSDNYILTARHCITGEGTIEGTPLTGSTNIKSTSVVNPGVIAVEERDGYMKVKGSPPSYTINTSVFFENLASFWDLAIIKATGDLKPSATLRRPGLLGFSSTQTATFVGTDVTIRGYGRNLDGTCYSHADSGAGVLRNASHFQIESVSSKSFVHSLFTQSDQYVWHGDSGGPIWSSKIVSGQNVIRLHGVNSGPTQAAGGQNLVDFVQAAFGHVYLVDQGSLLGSTVVGTTSNVAGSYVYKGMVNDGPNRQMLVNRSSGYLMIGGMCLNDETANGSAAVRLRSCGATPTRWNITAQGVIINRSTQKCLATYGDNLIVQDCGDNPPLWAFTADQHFG